MQYNTCNTIPAFPGNSGGAGRPNLATFRQSIKFLDVPSDALLYNIMLLLLEFLLASMKVVVGNRSLQLNKFEAQ